MVKGYALGRYQVRVVAVIVVVSIVAGMCFGGLNAPGEPLVGLTRGALTGAMISVVIGSIEVMVIGGRVGVRLRRLPFLVYLSGKIAVYVVAILAGNVLGAHFVPGMGYGTAFQMVTTNALIFSFLMAVAVNFVLEVNRLLGPSALANFLLGTYFRPREEDRVFVLLDLVNSTAIAERIGAVGYHRLLNGAFGALTPVLLGRGGDVHKYVGDEVIVTWPAKPGAESRALAFALDAIATITERAGELERAYGAPVGFRAAVHKGRVVAGELGDFKKEIALLGDPLNVAARLLQEARARDVQIIASGDALGGAILPPGARAEPLGLIALRGRSQPLELFRVAGA